MFHRTSLHVMLLIAAAFLTACQTADTVKTLNVRPDWMRGETKVSGMVCAVGASEPAYYREDAKLNAAENARKELARTISVNIDSIMVDMTTNRENNVDEATVMQTSSWATSTVVENSQIIDYWYDADGTVSKKDITYALACMPDNILKKR